MGSTLDPLVNSTLKGLIAVCGDRFAFTGLDENEMLVT